MMVADLLISLLVFGVLVWLVFFVLGQIPMPQPMKNIVTAVVAVIVLLMLIQHLGLLDGLYWHRVR